MALSSIEASDERLVLQLSSGMVAERGNAAYLLGMSEDPGALDLILNQLAEEPVKANKLVMIESIRKLDRGEGFERLSHFYRGESDPEVKRKVIQVLGESGDPRYVQLIEKRLYLSDVRDQQKALTALSHIKHPSATKALLQYLAKQSTRHQKDWALTAIAAQKQKDAVKPLIHLGKRSKESTDRARIAEVLGEIGDYRAQDQILVWFRESHDNTSKKRIARSLQGVGSSGIMGDIYKELKVSEMCVQVELIQTMNSIDPEAARPYLESFYEQLMENLDPHQPRMQAMTAIRLHRLLRDLLVINGDPSDSYPQEWKEDPILNHLIHKQPQALVFDPVDNP